MEENMSETPTKILSEYGQKMKERKLRKKQFLNVFWKEYNEIMKDQDKKKLVMRQLLREVKTITMVREDEIQVKNKGSYWFKLDYKDGTTREMGYNEIVSRHKEIISWFAIVSGLINRDSMVWGWTVGYESCRTPQEILEDICM